MNNIIQWKFHDCSPKENSKTNIEQKNRKKFDKMMIAEHIRVPKHKKNEFNLNEYLLTSNNTNINKYYLNQLPIMISNNNFNYIPSDYELQYQDILNNSNLSMINQDILSKYYLIEILSSIEYNIFNRYI